MKFAEHLGAHITPEWRKQYIQYEELKALLYAAIEQAPSEEEVEEEISQRYVAKFDESFFTVCGKELTKINTFYTEKLAEASRKFAALKSELEGPDAVTKSGQKKLERRKAMDLKSAFSEFYLSLILLQNYQNLNFTGFRKILKKHDKLLKNAAGTAWREENVETAYFYTNKDIDRLIADTEATVTSELDGGDRQKAMKRLRVPPLGDKQSPWTTFKVGLFSGAFLVLLIAMILSLAFHGFTATEENSKNWPVVVRLFRGPFLVILFLFLMGINVYGWRSSGVNHVLIFELDPRNHLSEQHLMELAAIFGVVWTMFVILFIFSENLEIPSFANPLALIVIMLLFLLNPSKTFRPGARFWLLKVLGRILLAPLFYVGFADFWLADQLNSLAQAVKDFQYVVCFYASHEVSLEPDWNRSRGQVTDQCSSSAHWAWAIVGVLPAWFRFAQCLRRYRDTREAFPHLVNAGKYSTTFFVVLFATLDGQLRSPDPEVTDDYESFFYLFVVASLVNTTYCYIWDIKMDWGFFAPNSGENKFLREEIVYSAKWYYYLAIVEDLVLRFSWVYILLLKNYGFAKYNEVIVSVFACLEVIRRFIWNFFRLENEHLNNCGKFRAVRDIGVAPLDASDQQQIIKLMDEEDPRNLFRKKASLKLTVAGGLLNSPPANLVRVPLLMDTDDTPLSMATNFAALHSVGAC